MRWQYPVAALAIAALVWTGVRIASTDAASSTGPAGHPQPASPAQVANAFSAASAAASRGAPPPPLPPRVTEYIAHEYANSASTREALTQIAHGWSQAVNNVHNPDDAKVAGNAIAQGIACALSPGVLTKAGVDPQTMLDRIKSTRAIMLDTEADTLAYIRFQSLAGGQYFNDPGPASCSFNPASLPN